MLTRCIRWTDESGGHEPQLFYRKAKLFLDSEHDFVLEMAPVNLARIKVMFYITAHDSGTLYFKFDIFGSVTLGDIVKM